MVQAQEVSEQMKLTLSKFRGNLDAGNDLHMASRRLLSAGDAVDRVVVGDGNGRQSATPGQIDDLLRRIGAVAMRRMQVQIGAAVSRWDGGGLAQRSKRLACGHVYAEGATF